MIWHNDCSLIAELLQNQATDFAKLSIEPLGFGWDNWIFRLGEQYVIRLPKRHSAIALLENEIRFLPDVARRVSIPIPEALFAGLPSSIYPAPWVITSYFEGTTADQDQIKGDETIRFARFLKSLHIPTNADFPFNPYRSVPLTVRQESFYERLRELKELNIDIPEHFPALFQQAAMCPVPEVQFVIHGDLHAKNIIVSNHIINAVVDWGDLTQGDIATDLAHVWGLFSNPEERAMFFQHYPCDSKTILRAKGWAVFFAVMLIAAGRIDSASHEAMGWSLLENLDVDLKQER